MTTRPSCIVSARDLAESTHVYPQSTERMGPVRRLGKSAGLVRIGVNLQRLPMGTRSSWPHAEEDEEETRDESECFARTHDDASPRPSRSGLAAVGNVVVLHRASLPPAGVRRKWFCWTCACVHA